MPLEDTAYGGRAAENMAAEDMADDAMADERKADGGIAAEDGRGAP